MMYSSDNISQGVDKLLDRVDLCQVSQKPLVFSENELYMLRNLLKRVKFSLDRLPRITS